ncbi:Hypothetical protein D9617_7g031460 [Elsinoe fawcettii]|nr:Hypothetical protein D9617_7g031460 [Elsinoe fawcettii]
MAFATQDTVLPKRQPSTNGLNGMQNSRLSGVNGTRKSLSRVSSVRILNGNQNNMNIFVVAESASFLKKQCAAELGAGVSQGIFGTSFARFMDDIHSERLSSLPPKGSSWDRVLIRATCIAEQIRIFELAIKDFAADSSVGAEVGYGHLGLLLQLGRQNTEALAKIFSFLYRLILDISPVLGRSDFMVMAPGNQEQVAFLFADLITLVTQIALRLHKIVNGMVADCTTLDVHQVFKATIDTFKERKDLVVESIWIQELDAEGVDLSEHHSIDFLYRWLSPPDHVLAALTRDHTTFADQQAEFTCLWFQKHLSRFIQSDETTMLVTGKSGCGKTSLSAAIADRLQRPLGRRSFSTVYCAISSLMPTQATGIGLAKSILYQLLELRCGSAQIYHSLCRTYELCRKARSDDDYEARLWACIKDALENPLAGIPELVLIVDGIDEIEGPKGAAAIFDRLNSAVPKGTAKLVVLSQSLTQQGGLLFKISDNDTRDDMHTIVRRKLKREGIEDESAIHHVIEVASGSFLAAGLACHVLRLTDKPNEAISLFQQKPSIEKLVEEALRLSRPNADALTVLSWLLESERPFSFPEIRALFSIDYKGGASINHNIDIRHITRELRPLISVSGDIVRIRHPEIMAACRSLIKDKKLAVPIKDAETDLLYRCLAYAKSALTERRDPTFEEFELKSANRLFNQHVLLEYVVRYWPRHFQQSPLGKKEGFNITPELTKVMPDAVTLSLLEMRCWSAELPTQIFLNQMDLASRLRGRVLKDSPVLLQTYIALILYLPILDRQNEAAKYCWTLSKIARTVFGESHELVMESCTRFLKITASFTYTSRTEIVTYREDILQILVSVYTKTYGSTSEKVIEIQQLLVDLYVAIHEEERANEILIIIRGRVDGGGVERDVPEHLRIHVRPHGRPQPKDYPEGDLFGYGEFEGTIEVFEYTHIEILLKRAAFYMSRGDIIRAEQTYIELWQHVSLHCRTTLSVKWHESNIDIAVAYSEFLKTTKRQTECIMILTAVWQQYEHHEVRSSEKIIRRLTSIAKTFKSFGYHSLALSIFQYAASFTSKESSYHKTIEEELSVTWKEVVKTTITESKRSLTTIDTFRSMITTSTLDVTIIKLAQKLTLEFMETQEYYQAISIIEMTLKRTWSSFFSETFEMVSLYEEESLELVERLVECYTHLRVIKKIDEVYTRLFRCVLVSKKLTLIERVRKRLIAFYDDYGFIDKAISVYQEILIVRRIVLGVSHKETIAILYILGSRCRRHARNHPYWIEYYQQIITALGGFEVCHEDAFEALEIVSTYYWEDRRYAEAISLYALLWTSFVKEYKRFTDTKFILGTYRRYIHCLEETNVELEVIHRVSTEFRETCVKAFGAKAEITIEATISLAKVCQRSDKYEEQSISLYEEVSSTRTEIKETLRTLYSKRITSISESSIEHALTIYLQQYSESKKKFGFSSTTLTYFRELTVLLSKQSKIDTIIKETSLAITEITKETSSTVLMEAAFHFAQTFQLIQQETVCHQLIEEMYLQVVARHVRKSTFSFDLTSCSSTFLVFLAGMHYHSRKDLRITFSEVMADLKFQVIQYDCIRRSIKAQKSTEVLLNAGSLCGFLRQREAGFMIRVIEDDLVVYFKREFKLQLRVEVSIKVFIVSVLGYVRTTCIMTSILAAVNRRVTDSMNQRQWNEAFDVASIGLSYIKSHGGFDGPVTVGLGFRLALLLASRGTEMCNHEALRKDLLHLSNKIVRELLQVCKDQEINLARVKMPELNQLAALLGDQKDYHTLEWLLSLLWHTRDAQRGMPARTSLALGRRLICARFLAGHIDRALRLCEDIAYNMRRVHGARHPASLDMYELLAQLYAAAGQQYQKAAAGGKDKNAAGLAHEHFRKALLVHEELLRFMVYEGTVEDSDDDDELERHVGDEEYEEVDRGGFARRQLMLLKYAFQRLGSWPKPIGEYERLNADTFQRFGRALKGVQGVETWSADGFGAGRAESADGMFVTWKEWEFVREKDMEKVQRAICKVAA